MSARRRESQVTPERARAGDLLQAHKQDVVRIARANNAENVRVFGSVARGEEGVDSDIDLLVTFTPDASVFDQSGLIEELERLLGRRVDVVSDRALRASDHMIRDSAIPL